MHNLRCLYNEDCMAMGQLQELVDAYTQKLQERQEFHDHLIELLHLMELEEDEAKQMDEAQRQQKENILIQLREADELRRRAEQRLASIQSQLDEAKTLTIAVQRND